MTESDKVYDVVVIGAGQAGLGIGYWLNEMGSRFLILERGRIGETWRSQRWDSFTVNTPNWANLLPGGSHDGSENDGFWTRDELVASFERYVEENEIPIRTGVSVLSVDAVTSGGGFVVRTDNHLLPQLETRTIVVASGIMQSPRIPRQAAEVPEWITQLHTADYRSPTMLPPGAVVVVGAGQSGCQIVGDLLSAGRTVHFCTSKVARAPRRYRGRDLLEWLNEMKFFDQTVDDLADPGERDAAQPQISGMGRYGRTVSLQQLEKDGARLLGRLKGLENGVLITDDDLAENIRFADEKSAFIKQAIEDYLERTGAKIPPVEDDPADVPAEPDAGLDAPTRLDLKEAGVSTIIWCTGFSASFDWLHLPVVDESGNPLHEEGISIVPGIYFLGFPWLRSRKSGILLGIEEDSRFIAQAIGRHLAQLA